MSNVSQTQENSITAIHLVELLSIPAESSFQLEQNASKQLILLQDAEIAEEAKDKLCSILKTNMIALYQNHPQMWEEPIFPK